MFDCHIGANCGRITPFVVRINGNDDFSVLAVGDTWVSGVDYSTTGAFLFQFPAGTNTFTLMHGETIATGFTASNADGIGNAGSVIGYDDGGEDEDEFCIR